MEEKSLPWLDPTNKEATRNGMHAFLPKGPGPVVWKEGYVFGNGRAGEGYYSMDTRDAYRILYRNLQKKKASQTSDYNMYGCCMGKLTDREMQQKENIRTELKLTKNKLAYAKARFEAGGPNVDLKPEKIARYGGNPDVFRRSNGDFVVPYDKNELSVAGHYGCGVRYVLHSFDKLLIARQSTQDCRLSCLQCRRQIFSQNTNAWNSYACWNSCCGSLKSIGRTICYAGHLAAQLGT